MRSAVPCVHAELRPAPWGVACVTALKAACCVVTHGHMPAPFPHPVPCRFVECEPDVLRIPPQRLQPSGAGDAFVLLGSDGLWDVLSDEDAVHCAKRALQVSSRPFTPAGHGPEPTGAPQPPRSS